MPGTGSSTCFRATSTATAADHRVSHDATAGNEGAVGPFVLSAPDHDLGGRHSALFLSAPSALDQQAPTGVIDHETAIAHQVEADDHRRRLVHADWYEHRQVADRQCARPESRRPDRDGIESPQAVTHGMSRGAARCLRFIRAFPLADASRARSAPVHEGLARPGVEHRRHLRTAEHHVDHYQADLRHQVDRHFVPAARRPRHLARPMQAQAVGCEVEFDQVAAEYIASEHAHHVFAVLDPPGQARHEQPVGIHARDRQSRQAITLDGLRAACAMHLDL